MLDLNEQARQAEERRANRVVALAGVQHLELEKQQVALLDALLDVEARIKQASGDVAIPARAPKSNGVVAPKNPSQSHSNGRVAVSDDGGPTEFIKSFLRQAAPKMRTAREIIDEAAKRKLPITDDQILQALTRMWSAKDRVLIRRGKPGKFRYGLKPAGRSDTKTTETNGVSVSGGTNAAENNDVNASKRVLAFLKSQPTADYGLLAEKVFGSKTTKNRVAARNACYYLEKSEQAVRRADKVWEAMPEELT